MPRNRIKRVVICSVEGCGQICRPHAKVCPDHKGMRYHMLRDQYREEGRCCSPGCPRWPEPGRRQCKVHLEYFREYNRKRAREKNHSALRTARKVRLEVIIGYGGACCICGESDPIVLELDHINGLDSVPKEWPRGGTVLYRHLIKAGFPKDLFQLLCANCHRRKTWADISVTYDDLAA